MAIIGVIICCIIAFGILTTKYHGESLCFECEFKTVVAKYISLTLLCVSLLALPITLEVQLLSSLPKLGAVTIVVIQLVMVSFIFSWKRQ